MSDLSNTTFRDYIRVLFRQKAVVITTFIVVMVTVSLGLMLKTPVYEASVKMLVSAEKQIESPYYRELIDSQNSGAIATQAEIVISDPILDRTVRALELYELPLDYEKRFCSPLKSFFVDLNVKMMNAKLSRFTHSEQQGFRYRMAMDKLRDNIKIDPIPGTSLFYINVRDFSGYGAAILANVVSRSYVIFDLEQQVAELQLKYGDKNLAVTQLKDDITKMEKSLNGAPVSNIEAIGPASVKIIEQAQIPIEPVGPNKLLIIFLSLFMSIFLGTMLAFIFEYLDPTFKSPHNVESELGLSFLGSIPRYRKEKILTDFKKIKGTYLNFYQILTDQIYLLIKDKKFKTVLVTSSGKEENIETFIVNLSKFLSQKGNHNILLIDANFRNHSLIKMLKIDNTIGLGNVIEGKCSLKEAIKDLGQGLHLMPSGITELNPVILLDSSKVKEILDEVAKKYEVVLIFCPNLKSFKDASVLATHTDTTILVISEGVTRRHVLKVSLLPLLDQKVNILGFVLSNRIFSIPKFVYERV